MIRLLLLSLIQSFCLAFGQMFLKLALAKMGKFTWSVQFFLEQLTNWWFLLVGISMGSATLLWLYILKNYPLSVAYPLTCLSYVFGLVAAFLFLHESIPPSRWIGVLCIALGVYFIIK